VVTRITWLFSDVVCVLLLLVKHIVCMGNRCIRGKRFIIRPFTRGT
jgi:hypothetical protein